MKYIIPLILLSIISNYATGLETSNEINTIVKNKFVDVEIHNTYIVGENGDFLTLTEALESDLVSDKDQILINKKLIDEGDITISKDLIIKSANHLKDQVVIKGKVTLDNSHVILDNLKINSIIDIDGVAIEVNGGSLTVYEHLELFGSATANKADINNYGKLSIIE